jgi:hypothetical protein
MFDGVLFKSMFVKHNRMLFVKLLMLSLLHWTYIMGQLTWTGRWMIVRFWLAHNWALLHNAGFFMASQGLTYWNPTDYLQPASVWQPADRGSRPYFCGVCLIKTKASLTTVYCRILRLGGRWALDPPAGNTPQYDKPSGCCLDQVAEGVVE